MSKPEPPRHIDAPPTAPRKGNWDLVGQQKQRASETRIGILLAFCLLVAIGFVAYRKWDERRTQSDKGREFQSLAQNTADAGDSTPPETEKTPTDAAGWSADPPPPEDLHASHESLASSLPPAQNEPSSVDAPEEAAFAMTPDPPTGSAPADTASGTAEAWDPFNTAGTSAAAPDPPDESGIANSTDVQSSAPTADSPTDDGTWTSDTTDVPPGSIAAVDGDITSPDAAVASTPAGSDASNPFAVAADSLNPAAENPPTAPVDQQNASADLESTSQATGDAPPQPAEAPVLDLFASEPLKAPDDSPEPATEPTTTASAPPPSPWSDPADSAEEADQPAPLLIHPNQAQAMAEHDDPFGSDAPVSAPDQADEPTGTLATSDPFPGADSDDTESDAGLDQPALSLPSTESSDVVHSAPATAPAESEPALDPLPSSSHARDPFAPATDVQQAVNETEIIVHTVQPGENFWSISEQHYGAGRYFSALAAYNQSRIPDPRRMRPGMKVLVPHKEVLAQRFPQLVSGGGQAAYVPASEEPPGLSLDSQGQPQYRVAKGDTLSGIAARHLGRASRWVQIYGMNRDKLIDANSLKSGMVLRLPADATQVIVAGTAADDR